MAPAKHALLIGVGDSPRIRKHPSARIRRQYRILRCCEGDVDVMRELLVERFGFPGDGGNVQVLKGEQATQRSILESVELLIERVAPGDTALLYYCGHGSRMRDPGDPDAMLETLVPYDTSRGPGENRDIPDLEIARWIERLSRKTPRVTVIFDCCHAGSMNRQGFGTAIQEAPADRRPVREIFAGGPVPPLFARPRGSGPRARSGWYATDARAVMVAACRAHEHSWELKLPDGQGYRYHAALSFHLSAALADAPRGATWRDVLERVATRVAGDRPAQHPQLEGDIDQPVLGDGSPSLAAPRPAAYLPVIAADDREVLLWGGLIQSVSPGSRWTVRPHGARDRHAGREIARVRVEQVAGTTARCRILDGSPGRIEGGQRAFLVEEDLSPPILRVAIDAPVDLRRQLEEALSTAGLLTLADETSADVFVHYLEPRTPLGPKDPRSFAGSPTVGSWVVLGDDETLMCRPRHAGEPLDELASDLDRLARYRRLRRLHNPDARSRLPGRVELRILGSGGERLEIDPEYGVAVVAEGGRADFEIENLDEEEVWVSLVELASDHSVTVLMPRREHPAYRRGGLRMAPGESLRVGHDYYRTSGGLQQVLPEGFPWTATTHGRPAVGVSHLRLLVTAVPADFEFLEHGPTRSEPVHPLEKLALACHVPAATRTVVLPPEEVARDRDWAVVARDLVILREAVHA